MQDRTDEGWPTRQRWRVTGIGSMTVDFLIPPSRETGQGGELRDIEKDFAAIIAPGLKLAFQDWRRVRIQGETIFGERATRDIWMCGPGAFVVLKALAFLGRGESKDAFRKPHEIASLTICRKRTGQCFTVAGDNPCLDNSICSSSRSKRIILS